MSDDLEKRQREVCRKYHAKYFRLDEDLMVVVSKSLKASDEPINGLRHPVEGQSSGWYIWGGEGDISTDPTKFEVIHVSHLREEYPPVLPFLALPPGWRFLVASGHEDVWEDLELLNV